jgi:hypothetical protein
MIVRRTTYALAILLVCPLLLSAQRYDTASIFNLPIELDAVVVKSNFDVPAFIRRIRTDTTFYKAFKSMRFLPYVAVNDFVVLNKQDAVTASMHSKTEQLREGNCRRTRVLEETHTGDFYTRRGGYNYYTAELFAYLFLAPKAICNETDVLAGQIEHGSGAMAKQEYQLKQLIFNPGSKVSGVPLMGDRASIFDHGEAEKYTFKITRELYDSVTCYVFRVTPKSGYEHSVLYDELTTWFRESDYSIIARNYSLSYHTMLYDFNVKMKARTTQIGGKLYPILINYDGDWHVFTKKRERVKFNVAITY